MRLKLTLQYKGTKYHGWQFQPHHLTIQEILQKALSQILGEPITVISTSRTDAGVHALGQVCHFDVLKEVEIRKLVYGLNSVLPDDIAATHLERVSADFHAQKSARRKTYDYYLLNSSVRSPFLKDFSWQVPYPLDLQKMKKAAKLLVGEHDFKSFCASDSTVKTTARKIYRIDINRGRLPLLCISITGSGFLKHMVRNMVGTLVEIGRGKMTLTQFKKAFKSRDRRQMARTAPAKGLFLMHVEFDK